jgi:hypothetical protein
MSREIVKCLSSTSGAQRDHRQTFQGYLLSTNGLPFLQQEHCLPGTRRASSQRIEL